MKHLLLTTIAAVLVVGCGEAQQSAPAPETKPVEPVAEASQPEPPTAKAPDISIHKAATFGNIEAVKQHLAKGADVNAKDIDGWTPLRKAALNGHKEIVELLINKGADVNAKDEDGSIPLHGAAFWGLKEVAELLIANGADVNAKDRGGFMPLDEAIINENTEIVDLLRKHDGKSGAEDSIQVAASVGNIEAVKQHLAAGTDVNTKDAIGTTPLLLAVTKGQREIVELLIAKGANVNAKADGGWTPLHYATGGDEKDIVELLIAKGANVNAKIEVGDYKGQTPLDGAIQWNRTETADLLRKHGGKTGAELKAESK